MLPILVREVDARAGLGWAARSMAFLCLALLLVANLVLRLPDSSKTKRKPRSLIDATALKDWPFLLFLLGCFVIFLGLYTPYVYIQSYALTESITSPNLALYVLAILNASSILGRILPILLAQRLGPMNIIIGTAFVLSTTCLCLTTTTNLAGLLAANIVYGFFTGTFFALQPTVFVRLTSDPRTMGTRFGMAFAVMSLALLFGPPISGALMGELGYKAAWIWAGLAIFAGGLAIAASRVCKAGFNVMQPV